MEHFLLADPKIADYTYPEEDDQQRATYSGLWRCGEPFQIGKMTWRHGATYDGRWDNGKPEGLGNFVYPEFKHEKTYRGKWVGGKRTGFGFLTMNDGDEYFGDFEQDEITGV